MANVHIHVSEAPCSSCGQVTLKVYYGADCEDISTSVTVYGAGSCLAEFVDKGCKLYKDEACGVYADNGYYQHNGTGGACDETTVYEVNNGVVTVASC